MTIRPLVSSNRAPDEIELYNPEWEQHGETDEEKRLIREGDPDLRIKPSRIYIKDRCYAGDQAAITGLTYQTYLKASESNPDVREQETKIRFEVSSIATAAVMVIRVEGALFTDPDTNRPLIFQGSLDARYQTAERLTFPVCVYIEAETLKLNTSPFATTPNESASETDSSPSSTPASSPKKTGRTRTRKDDETSSE